MTYGGTVVLYVGICLAIAGAVVGFTPVTERVLDLDIYEYCGSALGGGVASPPPICASPLRRAGSIALGFLGVGFATGAGAVLFGRR